MLSIKILPLFFNPFEKEMLRIYTIFPFISKSFGELINRSNALKKSFINSGSIVII